MAFNPDDYLSQKTQGQTQTQSTGFNPDEYLKAKSPETLGDVAGQAVSNLIPSFGKLVGGVAQTVMHPIDTAENLGKAVVGTGEAITGKIASMVNPELTAPPSEREKMANQIGDYYKSRYGSIEGLKNAIATDPAGVMADASTLFTGGGAIASKVPVLAKAGEIVSQAGAAVDPLALAAKGVSVGINLAGKGATAGLGMTTGAGAEAIKQAYQAGKTGGQTAEQFQGNLRGNIPMQDVLDTAKSDLAAMNAAKTAEYRNNMAVVKSDKSILDFSNIDKSLVDNSQKVMFGSQIKNTSAAEALTKISDEIGAWKNLDPAQYHTPEGLDALKQVVAVS